jgi:hypothetical protein
MNCGFFWLIDSSVTLWLKSTNTQASQRKSSELEVLSDVNW